MTVKEFLEEFIDWAENCADMFTWHEVESLDADEGWMQLVEDGRKVLATLTAAQPPASAGQGAQARELEG